MCHRTPPVYRPTADNLGDRSPRDPRRLWARLLPRPTFTNPTAVYLAAWADAIQHAETWEAWIAAHPEGGPL